MVAAAFAVLSQDPEASGSKKHMVAYRNHDFKILQAKINAINKHQ